MMCTGVRPGPDELSLALKQLTGVIVGTGIHPVDNINLCISVGPLL
jgi:hypothetical protein